MQCKEVKGHREEALPPATSHTYTPPWSNLLMYKNDFIRLVFCCFLVSQAAGRATSASVSIWSLTRLQNMKRYQTRDKDQVETFRHPTSQISIRPPTDAGIKDVDQDMIKGHSHSKLQACCSRVISMSGPVWSGLGPAAHPSVLVSGESRAARRRHGRLQLWLIVVSGTAAFW